MNNITPFDDFMTEGILSAVSDFLKSQFNNIFKDSSPNLKNLFTQFTKSLDKEKNMANLYQRYILSSQPLIQNDIKKAESIDEVNKIITDNIKFLYFSLNPIIKKVGNKDFTIQELIRDKALQELLSNTDEKEFSNNVQYYVNNTIISQIKRNTGLYKKIQNQEQPQQNNEQTKENIMFNISRILEADETIDQQQTEDLEKYKKGALDWFNTIFTSLKNKKTILNTGANTGIAVDQASKAMKGTTNDNAKDAILNKIMNMEKEELQKLVNYLGLKDLGNL